MEFIVGFATSRLSFVNAPSHTNESLAGAALPSPGPVLHSGTQLDDRDIIAG